jgi:hypothetical protein
MDKVVLGMAALRFLSASIEFTVAILILYFGRVETAVKINAVLAMVGPTVLISVTPLGLVGLAGKVSPVDALHRHRGWLYIPGLRHL